MKVLFLLVFCSSTFFLPVEKENTTNTAKVFLKSEMGEDKAEAFTVLVEKCNVCHEAKKRVIFTLGNMETYAADIHRQVFVKKRMPKGRKFPLTEMESETLKNWLDTVDFN